ncbi:MAG: glycerate kinase [Halarchaeum sp.]
MSDRDARRRLARECVTAGIDAANPARVVRDELTRDGGALRIGDETVALDDYEDVVVLGGGNAAAGVAAALEDVLGERLSGGLVVTDDPVATERVTVRRADHPTPSERGRDAARELCERAERAGEETLVLAVVTGGASALLPAPASGLSLDDVRATTDALLESGATIDEVNAVRKHCSALKGGRLARLLAPARVVTLAFSDVVGDDLAVVGSGPTVPDPTTYADALAVLDGYEISVPDAVRAHLDAGARSERDETPDTDESVFARVTTHVLATNRTTVDAAAERAHEAGYDVLVLSTRIRGEAREAATTHVAVAEEVLASGDPIGAPCVVLSGGECTVTVRGDGTGGPNQEFALSAARDVPAGATLAAVDTDGRDGATDAAGAIVDSETLADRAARREATRALRENDAYPVLDDADALLTTGRTGTNVNDLRVLVVDDPNAET